MSDVISSDLDANEKDCWATPQWLFDALDKEFNFGLDAAANKDNAKLPLFITEQGNSLKQEWIDYTMLGRNSVWLNPPYSRGMIAKFMKKALEQSKKHKLIVVLLVPATADASWWPKQANEIRFITNGRISFINPQTGKPVNGNTKGSAIIVFNPFQSGCVTRYVDRSNLQALSIDHELSKVG